MSKSSNNPFIQRIFWLVLKLYLTIYHRFEVITAPDTPKQGPLLALTSHFSILDVVSLMVADPYFPNTTLVVKETLKHFPIVGMALRAWGTVFVARGGQDLAAVRDILNITRQGRNVCIAAQGTRSRTGHLGPMHPVLMRIALEIACKGIPVIPAVEVDTWGSLPPGARLPRPKKIRVMIGGPIDFSPWCGKRVTHQELTEVATLVQSILSDMLPPERRPLPGTPPLGTGRPDDDTRM